MRADPIAHNLDIVERHIRDEACDPAFVMALYSDDIGLEMPTRGLALTGKAAIEANYRAMFGAMEEVEILPGDRFATPERVVDDCIVRFRLVREGMKNAPVPVGSTVELRLVHIFHMRDGLIAREIVTEGWKRLDERRSS